MFYLLSLFLFVSGSAWATALVNRFQYVSADSLPDGVWTFAVSKGQSAGGTGRSFGPNGSKLSNAEYYSRGLEYRHLLDEINDPMEKELAQAAFAAYGKDLNESAGRVVNTVDISQKSDTYILGRGFGKKNSLFIIFPIVTINTRFRSDFQLGSSLQKLAQDLANEGQHKKAQEILEKSQTALSERLQENGYRTDYPRELTTLANIWLNHRYEAITYRGFKISTDSNLIVPAGHKTNEDDFLYLRINEEQFSYRQGLNTSYEATKRFSILNSVYYHKRFAFDKNRRVPQNEVSPLSNDVDRTRTQYGDAYGTGLQVNAFVKDGIGLYAGQSYEIKNRDRVSGSKYDSSRYDYLEYRTSQDLSISYLGLTVNTIESFLRQEFPIPVEMNLQYSKAMTGKNTFRNEMIAMNLMVFYK